ncbi:hypothetical protein [Rhizobium sp.]
MQWNVRTDQFLAHPDSLHIVCQLGRGFVEHYGDSPRFSAMFASQQRWLMSHVAMKLYFLGVASAKSGLTQHGFVQAVVGHQLASRNTARAVIAEALKYGMVRPVTPVAARTPRSAGAAPLELSEVGAGLLVIWFSLHLRALDALDGGARTSAFSANPIPAMTIMEPFVCDALLASADVHSPGPAYAHFTWMDQGGLLMDRLMAGVDHATLVPNGRAVTDITSVSELARRFSLSRSHVARKLVDGEREGHIGWTGRRGHSGMWISSGFRMDYARAQMLKLAIIDAAFAAAFPS